MRLRFLPALLLLTPIVAYAQIPTPEYASRRAAVLANLPDGVLLVLGAPEPERDYIAFHQEPRFEYLTGFRETDAALVVHKQGNSSAAFLFVQPRNPAQEVWSGYRLGVDGATRATGIQARLLGEMGEVLDSLLRVTPQLHMVGSGGLGSRPSRDPRVPTLLASMRETHSRLEVTDPTGAIRAARGFKSAAELDLIRRAVEITTIAHRDAMRKMAPGMNEFELQAVIEYNFRRYGADRPAFASIVGSGPNSTILHYNKNDRFMQAGEVVVIDIGANYRGYSADVTRTIPVSGTFSPEQREIYQIVRAAQAAAESQARVGASYRALSDTAAAVLAAGLTRLGLIDAPTATFDCGNRQCSQLQLYYMHGLGHGIGLEVHDPDQYQQGAIGVGSVFTIEPGIYVRSNLLDEVIPDVPANAAFRQRVRPALERYRNIGVRIEDDFQVTADGLIWLSRGAPREIDEIEALMREPWTGPSEREPAKVEWYRETGRPSRD